MRMRPLAWIWFLGCAVWLVDGGISVRLHAMQHAELAFLLSAVFLAAGLLYRQQRPR